MNSELHVGFGYDIHRLIKGKSIYLGGIRIPFSKKFLAHSDGDVLLHAVCDSLLGAATLKDIGHYFPNTEKKYKNISSVILLKETCGLLKKAGYKIINIDTMLVIKQPRISPYTAKMKKLMSKIAGTKHISIKATTNEGVGEIGKGKAICAYSVCLIEKC
ncbi:MAG: 2-C-methyl-D-erythritol 2,4-cyclodiphosphate synthase [Elusimicrobia bacterium]|nr:2-C-methyl-D-erythritol 2,4-cyclodiphosphate synthase [Elusimicrobiota bacterium]